MITETMEKIDVGDPDESENWRFVPHNFEDEDFEEGQRGEVGYEEGDEGCVILITANGKYRLMGKSNCNRVVVGEGLKCDIVLDNCRICMSNYKPPLTMGTRTDVNLHLTGDNMLIDGGGTALRMGADARLTIDDNGWLTVKGLAGGGIFHSGAESLVINSGRITSYGAIGCKKLTVNGGDIFVKGISSGLYGIESLIINGGVIDTVGGLKGAHIIINGGTIKAKSGSDEPGIGHTYSGETILITGGNITACDSVLKAGIGIGKGGSITISGGNVKATSIISNPFFDNKIGACSEGGPVTITGGHVQANAIEGHPLTISGKETVVEAWSVSTTDFGGATVRLERPFVK